MRTRRMASLLIGVLLLGVGLVYGGPGLGVLPGAARSSAATLAGEWAIHWERVSERPRRLVGVASFSEVGDSWTGQARISYGLEGSRTLTLVEASFERDNAAFSLREAGGETFRFTGALSGATLAGEVSHLALEGPEPAGSFVATRGLPPFFDRARTQDPRMREEREPRDVGLDPIEVSNVVLAAEATRSHALVVLSDGVVVIARGFGHEFHPMPLYSVTKPIAALALAPLAEGGALQLEDPVSRWFPEFAGDQRAGVTLRQILAHTSGLDPGETSTLNGSADRVAYARAAALVHPPGSTYAYNNRAFQLLSGIVRAETGQSLADALRDRVFVRLGIHDGAWTDDDAGNSGAYAGLSMHPMDLAVLGATLADHGSFAGTQVVPQSWVAQLCEPAPAPATRMGGGGWVLRRMPESGPEIGFGHSGDGGQYLLVYPAARLVGIRLIGWQELPEENRLVFGAFGRMMDDLATAKLAASSGASPGRSLHGHCD